MILRAAVIAVLWALALGATDGSAQGTNPFAGAKPPAPAAEAKADTAPAGGSFAVLGRSLLALQRDANRAMAQGMRAVRDGGGLGGAFVAALGLAFAYGVFHALGPGHGKFVVVSYFLSRNARIGRGIAMGTQIATFHVVSAIVVVALADYLLRQSFGGAPAEIPAVRLISYGIIALIGVVMTVQAGRKLLMSDGTRGHSHDDGHDHHHHGRGWQDQSLLSLAVGLIPCTGAVLVLLYALANDVIVAGLALTVSIGIGMALTMSLLGLLCVLARAWTARRFERSERPRLRRIGIAVELAGALVIAGLGGFFLASA